MVFSPGTARKIAQAAARKAKVKSRVQSRTTTRKTAAIKRKHNSGQQGFVDSTDSRGNPTRRAGGRYGIEQRTYKSFTLPGQPATRWSKAEPPRKIAKAKVTDRDLRNIAPEMAKRYPGLWKKIKAAHPSWSNVQIMKYINKGGR